VKLELEMDDDVMTELIKERFNNKSKYRLVVQRFEIRSNTDIRSYYERGIVTEEITLEIAVCRMGD
jgi:hypothetical protein